MKDRKVIILGALSVVFFLGMVASCNNAMRQKDLHDKEMAARLQLEEKMNKFSQERAALEEKVKAREEEAEEAREELEKARSALAQQQPAEQTAKEGQPQEGN